MKNLHSGLILLCLLFFFSCQKEETFIQEDPVITTEITLKNIIADDPLMDKFFNGINDHDIPVSADKKETIDRIKLAMIKDHKTTPFVDGYIREVGFPLWGQAKLHQQGSGNFVYALPFAKKASTFTTAILHVASINEKFVYELALRTDVKEYLVAYNTDSQTFYWENLLGFLAGFNAYDENIFGFSDSFILEWLSQNQDTYLVDAADTRGCSGAVLRYCQDNYALDERGDERSSPCGPSQIDVAIVIIVCESPTGGGGSPNVPIIGDDDNLGGGGSPNDGGSSPGGSPTFEDRLCNIDASISFFQTYNIQPTAVLRDALGNIAGCEGMSQGAFNEQALEIVTTIRAEQMMEDFNLSISVEDLLEIIGEDCPVSSQGTFEECVLQVLEEEEEESSFPITGWLHCNSFDLQPALGGSVLTAGIDDLSFIFDLPDGTIIMNYLFDADIRIPTQAVNGETLDADGIRDCLSRAFNYAGKITGITISAQISMGGSIPNQEEVVSMFFQNANNAFNNNVLPTWWGILPCNQINNSTAAGFMLKQGSFLTNRTQANYTNLFNYAINCW